MKKLFKILMLLFFSIHIFCINIQYQGVHGKVIVINKHYMPLRNPKLKENKIQNNGIKSEIIVFKKINLHDVQHIQINGTFFATMPYKIFKKISSDSLGFFKAYLPAGEYSLLLKKGDGYYCNEYNYDTTLKQTFLNVLKIYPNTISNITIKMEN